jgi:hypothetical protein
MEYILCSYNYAESVSVSLPRLHLCIGELFQRFTMLARQPKSAIELSLPSLREMRFRSQSTAQTSLAKNGVLFDWREELSPRFAGGDV